MVAALLTLSSVATGLSACHDGGAPPRHGGGPTTSDRDSPAKRAGAGRDRTVPGPEIREHRPVPPPAWRSCPRGECARLPVPLRHGEVGGPRLALDVFRHPARRPDRRIGPLLVNPGGPGVPGVPLARRLLDTLPEEILDRFDIVGWDPRGTGGDRPVDCGPLDGYFALDTAPDDPAELEALRRGSRALARACARRSGPLLAHVSTDDTVADMEVLRRALGAERISFLGFSYGTFLGARYAATHPDRVRAMVLDGALDPALPVPEVLVDQARGFDAALARSLAACASDDRCPLRARDGGGPRVAYDALRARVERAPIRTRLRGERRELGPAQLDLAVGAVLYLGRRGDRLLANGIAAALGGDPGPLLEAFDDYVRRGPGGRYGSLWPAFLATTCLDGPPLPESEAIPLLDRAAREAPDFGAATVGLSLPCAFWPVTPVRSAPGPVRADGAPPILVIGTTGDPATPYRWAEALAAQLGVGRLVTVAGRSHTAAFDGNRCLDRIVERYLRETALPPPGARC